MNDLSDRSDGFAVMVNGWLSIARPARKNPEVVRSGDRPGIQTRQLAAIC
ncbi:MAG: hypothetical protein PS018_29265 [bacterium]|nr:hypothetical protein [bacterium]